MSTIPLKDQNARDRIETDLQSNLVVLAGAGAGKTHELVRHLYEEGVLVTGLAYPVVPRGDEEIRTQVNADHTEADIDRVLAILEAYTKRA